MRLLPLSLFTTTLIAACGDGPTELTIVAPDLTHVMLQEDGGPWKELPSGPEIHETVDGPFTLIGVCDPYEGARVNVHVVQASPDDGARWWLGACDGNASSVGMELAGIPPAPRPRSTSPASRCSMHPTARSWPCRKDGGTS